MKLGMTMVAAAVAMTVLGSAATAGAKDEGKMTVKRLVLAHGVDAREPQEATSRFKRNDDRVYAFVEVANSSDDGKISVVFQPPTGGALAEIPLEVKKSPRFRTWAFTRKAHEAGQWGVTVRDEKGRILAKETFTVE
jgi:hypothetical protein